jgi:hypothetical protein
MRSNSKRKIPETAFLIIAVNKDFDQARLLNLTKDEMNALELAHGLKMKDDAFIFLQRITVFYILIVVGGTIFFKNPWILGWMLGPVVTTLPFCFKRVFDSFFLPEINTHLFL